MPNIFIENRDRWLSLSEIDYLGQFVKAWLAFNAWYRSAYDAKQDRIIINEIKWQPNQILNKLRPLLTNGSEEAQQFRAEIGLLHHRLENYELHSGKGNEKQRITLTNIYLKDNPPKVQSQEHRKWSLKVERLSSGNIKTEVKDSKDVSVLQHQQARFDLTDLEAQQSFQKSLTQNLQGILRQLYKDVVPVHICNLLEGQSQPIQCGAYEFRCERDSLYAGIVEALYLMRCTLFHGELVPTKEAIACYEPAYRLLRRFLECAA